MKKNLTILLTTKGRESLSYRWLEYFNIADTEQFDLIIADGSSEPILKDYVHENFSSKGNVRYFNWGPDHKYSDFYSKVNLALIEVATEYCVFADNDDFYDFVMFKKCIEFLNGHLDYSACGGQVIQLRVDTLLSGKSFKTYINDPKSLDHDEASERLRTYFKGASGPYYFVVRTDVVRQAWKWIKEADYKNIRFPELLHDSTIIALGKVKAFARPYYFRALDHGQGNEFGISHNFLDEVLAPTWSDDLSKTLDWIKILCPGLSGQELTELFKIFLMPRMVNGLGHGDRTRLEPKISRILINKALKSCSLRQILSEYVSVSLAKRRAHHELDLSTIESLILKYKKS